MIRIRDKLAMYQKVLETDIAEKTKNEMKRVQQLLQEELSETKRELKRESKEQQNLINIKAQQRIEETVGKQEQANAIEELKTMDRLRNELLEELEEELKAYVMSPVFFEKVQEMTTDDQIDQVEAKSSLKEDLLKIFPEAQFIDRDFYGLIVQDTKGGVRYDFRLERILKANQRLINQTFRRKIGK